MSVKPLSEITGLKRVGQLPESGDLVYTHGAGMYVLPDPARFPASVRPAVEARNVATVTGTCPLCGEWRAAMHTPPIPGRVDQTPHVHEDDCPASDSAIRRALTTTTKEADDGP